MKIKGDRGVSARYFVFAPLICVGWGYVLLNAGPISGKDLFYAVAMTAIAVWAVVSLCLSGISYGRSIELDEKGCTISLGGVRRFYAWERYVHRSVETYAPLSRYPEKYGCCVYLSMRPHERRRRSFRRPLFQPWTHIVLHPKRQIEDNRSAQIWQNYSGKAGEYEVDAALFRQKMREWGVEIEGLDKFQ